MILVTGGAGFIGTHTVHALLELGEDCVVTQHTDNRGVSLFETDLDKRVFVEQVDLTKKDELLAIGKKHKITGIVHLAAPGFGGAFTQSLQDHVILLANVLEAAEAWGVRRVTLASALGVYAGNTELPWHEDALLPLTAPFPIVGLKKISEIVADFVNRQGQIECIALRIAGVFGPLQNPAVSVANRLAHAAASGEPVQLDSTFFTTFADDGFDYCYVKDVARGIALLQTAAKLNHRIYNVASGRPTKNQDIADAVKKIVPSMQIDLPSGSGPYSTGEVPYQDIGRLQADTGYQPQFSLDRAMADYIDWLRQGHKH